MSNVIEVSMVSVVSGGHGVVASDNYHSKAWLNWASAEDLYAELPTLEALLSMVASADEFADLTFVIDERGCATPDEDSPYSGIAVDGFCYG